MKTQTPKREPEATEADRFQAALRKIMSVKKTDLNLHEPIRPRSPKGKASTSPQTSTKN